jgi:DNA-binding NtrC family response regulator
MKSPDALKVLWIEDDHEFTAGLYDFLCGEGYEIDCVQDLASARSLMARTNYGLVLVDLSLPDGSGLSLIRETPRSAGREFVVLSGQASVKNTIEALRYQVFDFLVKPLELSELRNVMARVRNAHRALSTSASPTSAAASHPSPAGNGARAPSASAAVADAVSMLIGPSGAMERVRNLVARAAPSEITVLIQGESGTGKEVVAQSLHRLSNRSAAPFHAVNCAAVSPSLIASELFGHEKGSFTGAHRTHAGIFERAEGGTLLLDEVTEMPIDLQATLLRVLETGAVVRVGGATEIPVNVRVIAATNRDPVRQVETGRFRLDLYYRLQVFPIELTPLRERPEDILPMAEHFLSRFAVRDGRTRTLTPGAASMLLGHDWPGNARELRNVVDRACLLSGDVIEPQHLLLRSAAGNRPPAAGDAGGSASAPDTTTLHDNERELILKTLQQCRGNKTRAAAVLGISVKTMYNKLKSFGYQDGSTV